MIIKTSKKQHPVGYSKKAIKLIIITYNKDRMRQKLSKPKKNQIRKTITTSLRIMHKNPIHGSLNKNKTILHKHGAKSKSKIYNKFYIIN